LQPGRGRNTFRHIPGLVGEAIESKGVAHMRAARLVLPLALLLTVALTSPMAASGATRGVNGRLTQAVANPKTPDIVNSGWVNWTWDSSGTAGPFKFTTAATTYMIVVDSYCRGDQFAVYDNGEFLGNTTSVPMDPECDDLPARDGPIESFLDPTYSSWEYTLEAGHHVITIVVIVNPFGGGGAYIGLGFTAR
jgi:hypothetical protein